jgi:multiple sugar transport system ATP-binding protein
VASVTYDHVTKQFGDVVAVNDFSLEVKDKEFLVLVGPSGCGKTTCLRMLAGLEQATEGEIYIGDRMVNDVAPKDRDIAMVFQNYALYPHMNVFDNMAYGLKLRGMKKTDIRGRVERAATDLGVGNLLERKPKELSGGQQQRVALGRAIVREPQAFLMDEPLSNLDAQLRVDARAMLIKLHQDVGTTFIYVTHDQIEAMTMGERIAVMNEGICQQLDTPQTLYDFPANLFVARFIGSPSMNFFDAELRGTSEEMYVDTRFFEASVPEEQARLLDQRIGQKVVFGIRPEHIHDRQFAPPRLREAPVTAKVDVVEAMGPETHVHLKANGNTFVARVDPRTSAVAGNDLEVVLNMDCLHLFDAETGDALLQAQPVC